MDLVIFESDESFIHSLLNLAPFLLGKPFCLVTNVSIFSKVEFSQFIDYSKMQEDADNEALWTNT